jgi:hypothetical protein
LLKWNICSFLVARESLGDVAVRIYAEQGLRGFWTGLVPRVARVAPASAVMLSSFEFFRKKRIFQRKSSKHENIE